MLSRFRSHKEQMDILAATARGEIDILIGTHRLLQADVVFKTLGLLIIDEEQRFGVTHKERLKQMRTEVDVLTMTATPIPRTLYMSLSGIRDISIIQTPPEERLPVLTYVGPYDERTVRQAILREMDRGGQVFYLHNRVSTIYGVERHLKELVPEVSIAIGHGQMHEDELERVMAEFAPAVMMCCCVRRSSKAASIFLTRIRSLWIGRYVRAWHSFTNCAGESDGEPIAPMRIYSILAPVA